ncbi:hypothetical protein PR048_010958 [Dryococelus australis]|uniref:Uncharacterized protein n=1 Tax=Dryococelus australis TaxID=614101 RepID=A0ABQ9HKB6_9NEOP|nr:hypothetical protein PR048_010958 [Dryococelus australis]
MASTLSTLVSHGSIWAVLHDRLSTEKFPCSGYLIYYLRKKKYLRIGITLQHLLLYHQDLMFLTRLVMGNEAWCYHFEEEMK